MRKKVLLPKYLHERFLEQFPDMSLSERVHHAFEWAMRFPGPPSGRLGIGERWSTPIRGEVPNGLARSVAKRARGFGMTVPELVRQAVAWRLGDGEA